MDAVQEEGDKKEWAGDLIARDPLVDAISMEEVLASCELADHIFTLQLHQANGADLGYQCSTPITTPHQFSKPSCCEKLTTFRCRGVTTDKGLFAITTSYGKSSDDACKCVFNLTQWNQDAGVEQNGSHA